MLLLVLNLLAATPRKREWVSNPNLCLCNFFSVSTFATPSFINSSHILFLSGKGMFFGTDQPWVKFYSSLINFSIAGLIMKLHKVLWPSLLVGTLGTAEWGPCYELTKGTWNFSSILLLALLIACTILQSKVHEFGYYGLFFGLSVLHLVTGIHCKSRPLDHKVLEEGLNCTMGHRGATDQTL